MLRRHSKADGPGKLFAIVSVWVHTRVCREDNLGAHIDRERETLSLNRSDFTFLVDVLFGHAIRRAHFECVFGVIDIERKVGAAIYAHLHRFTVQEARVLNRINARDNSPLNAFIAVRVRRDLSSVRMRLIDNGLHLFKRVLRHANFGALRKHAAGCAELGQIGTIFNVLTNLFAHFPRAVCDSVAAFFECRVQGIVIAVAARDAETRSRYCHARPRNFARVDGVA